MRVRSLNTRSVRWAILAGFGLSVAACQPRDTPAEQASEAGPVASDEAGSDAGIATDEAEESKSVMRPDIEQSTVAPPKLEPISLSIPFPAKGAQPEDAGIAMLDKLLNDPSFTAGGPITLWGHSDSAGSDTVNLAASRRRAEAVRDYLVGKGVAASRITVIAMGESRPIAPNRKLDGSDDLEGRSKNRRVEIKVEPPEAAPTIDPAATSAAQDGTAPPA